MQKLNITQKRFIENLLNNNKVKDWDKTLLNGIKGNNFKNVSPADNTLLINIFKRYEDLKWVTKNK